MKKLLFWLALASLIFLLLLVALPLVRFYLAVDYGVGVDPRAVVQQCMDGAVPKQSITFAKQTSLGVDPTFIAIISAEGVTNWPAPFYNVEHKRHIGRDGQPTAQEAEDRRPVVASRFIGHPGFPDSNALAGFESSGGLLKGHPFLLNAIVSKTNAYIVLEKY